MNFSDQSIKPIYQQIAEWIEDEILKGNIHEEEKVLSTNQFASLYKINPATAGKGLNLLVEQNILYKKRGIGMFVSTGAKKMLIEKKKDIFYKESIEMLLHEAEKLGITKDDIIEMLRNR